MKLSALLVSDYMTPNPIVIEPEEPLMRALEIVRLRGVRRLPVTVGGMLVGLVTEGDLKRAEPSTLTDSEADFNRVMEETPVTRIMIQNPVTTTADTPCSRRPMSCSTPSTAPCPWWRAATWWGSSPTTTSSGPSWTFCGRRRAGKG